MTISVLRAGRTASSWYGKGDNIHLVRELRQNAVKIRFDLDSKGGGVTEVLVQIDKDSFPDLVRSMMRVSRSSTNQAFIDAINAHEFEGLARGMMRMAPAEAIRAFGAALQAYQAAAPEENASGGVQAA